MLSVDFRSYPSETAGYGLLITISDTGSGIDKELLEEIRGSLGDKQTSTMGIGMGNIYRRIKMLKMLIIQGIGAIGFILLSLSYYKKEKKDILFYEIVSYIFFGLHFYLLNGITGTICNIIGLVSLVTIYLFDKYKLHNRFLISTVFVLLLLIINIITFQNIYSIFPMIASIIVIISFLSNNENHIRIIGVISAMCWLIYAIVYKSYISIIFELMTLFNVCLALYKNIGNKNKVTKRKWIITLPFK